MTFSGPKVTFRGPEVTNSDSSTSPYLHMCHLSTARPLEVKLNFGCWVAINFNVSYRQSLKG